MAITKAAHSPFNEIEVIPTGFPTLDKSLGIGGIPLRRITEISGKFSVGKTTLALKIVAQAQKKDLACLWAETEYSWDNRYAASLGVDTESLDLLQDTHAEAILDTVEEWAREHKHAIIIIDSIGSLLPREEAEKHAGERTIGSQAKLISAFLRKIVPILAINNNGLVVLNHIFIDVMTGFTKNSGGEKLGYHKSLEIRLARSGTTIKQSDRIVGRKIDAKIVKNKLAATQDSECELSLIYGAGFSVEADLLGNAIERGVIIKKGANFFMDGEKVAFGQTQMREKMKDPVFAAKIKEKLL